MPFRVWVYSEGRRAFPVEIPGDHVQARALRAAIAREPDGKKMDFAASEWGVFPAAHDSGTKDGAELPELHSVKPTEGTSDVNVWVERIANLAASGGGGELPRAVGPTGLLEDARAMPPTDRRPLSSILTRARQLAALYIHIRILQAPWRR